MSEAVSRAHLGCMGTREPTKTLHLERLECQPFSLNSKTWLERDPFGSLENSRGSNMLDMPACASIFDHGATTQIC